MADINLERWLRSGNVTITSLRVEKRSTGRGYNLVAHIEEVEGDVVVTNGNKSDLTDIMAMFVLGALNAEN